MSQWRITLDPPYQFATEPGATITRHCREFAPNGGVGLTNAISFPYKCPVTGIVMLQPSVFNNNWVGDLQPLTPSGFSYTTAEWTALKRTADNANMMSSVIPTASSSGLTGLTIGTAIAGVVAAIGYEAGIDDLKFVLSGSWNLDTDESFALHYHSLNDEMDRKNHWLYVQWDNIGIHLSPQGMLRAFRYNNGVLADPDQIYQGALDDPSSFHGKDGFIWFLPIPTIGLVVIHGKTPDGTTPGASSTSPYWSRGILIPITEFYDSSGNAHLFNASNVNLAVNPYHQYVFGFQRVSWGSGAACTFLDGVLEPEYVPGVSGGIAPVMLRTANQLNTSSILSVGDNQFRAQIILSTSDVRYTPFLYGYQIVWPPVFTTRDTVPTTIYYNTVTGSGDKITHLEYSEFDVAKFEGKCTIFGTGDSDALTIALRGDAAFLLENSEDGVSWSTVFGGLAKHWEIDWMDGMQGECFTASFTLCDMRENIKEQHILRGGVLDGKSITQAMNSILQSVGHPPLITGNYPPVMDTIFIPRPKDSTGWKFEIRLGEDASEALDVMLLFLRTQNTEYRLRWDWDFARWIVEAKPHDNNDIWQLYNTQDLADETSLAWYYNSLHMTPEPPEANTIDVVGLTASSTNQYQNQIISQTIYNPASFTDQTSLDYLGRVIYNRFTFFPAPTFDDVNKFLLQLYDVVCHHHGKATIGSPLNCASLTPGVRLQVIRSDGSTVLIDGWIKKKTITISNTVESMSLEFDTVWTGDLPHA